MVDHTTRRYTFQAFTSFLLIPYRCPERHIHEEIKETVLLSAIFILPVTLAPGRIQNMDRGPWTTRWTWSMDHPVDPVHGPSTWTTPWTTPNFQKEIAPVNMKIYRIWKTDTAYVLEVLSRNRGLLWIEGAGASYVTRQPTPSKVMLRLIRKLNTRCTPPLKLQAIQWIKLFSSICLDYKFVFVG